MSETIKRMRAEHPYNGKWDGYDIATAFGFLCREFDSLRAEMRGKQEPVAVEVTPEVLRDIRTEIDGVRDKAIRQEDCPENPACNFCGKRRREVAKLVSGKTAFICNECVGLCVDILVGEGFRKLPPDRFDCATCGAGVSVDEDGLCKMCGSDCDVILGGKVFRRAETEEDDPQSVAEPLSPAEGLPKEEEFRAGLPAKKLRDVWRQWIDDCGDIVLFVGDCGYHWSCWDKIETQELPGLEDGAWPTTRLRPWGTTWIKVEAMARAGGAK